MSPSLNKATKSKRHKRPRVVSDYTRADGEGRTDVNIVNGL